MHGGLAWSPHRPWAAQLAHLPGALFLICEVGIAPPPPRIWRGYGRAQPFPLLKAVLLFQPISPRGAFKNSNSLLIGFLKMPQCITATVNNAMLWMKIYWSQGGMSGSVLRISPGNHFQSPPVTSFFHGSPSLNPCTTLDKPQNFPGLSFAVSRMGELAIGL